MTHDSKATVADFGFHQVSNQPTYLATVVLALVGMLFQTHPAGAHVYQFDTSPAAAIPTVAMAGGGTSVYTSNPSPDLAIADDTYDGTQASMTCNTLTVPSEPGLDSIYGPVTVSIAMSHTYVGDLVIKLFAPTGTYTLVSRPGVIETLDDGNDSAGFGDSSNLAIASPLLYSMAAATEAEAMGVLLGNNGVICSGGGACDYNPNAGSTAQSDDLALLNGTAKNGNWVLCIGDAANTDTGVLAAWTLDLGSTGPPDTSDATCDSGASSLNVTFSVSDSFTATSIAVALNASHNERGDIRARLAAPDGSVYALLTQSGDKDANYDILMSSNSDAGEQGTAPVGDGDDDPTAEPYFNRLVTVAGLSPVSEAATGNWTLRVCDRDNNAVTGTLNRARLVLLNSTAAAQVCTSRMDFEWGDLPNNTDFTTATRGGVTITQVTANGDQIDWAAGYTDNHRTRTDTANGETGYYRLFMDALNTAGIQDSEVMGQLARFQFSESVQDLQFSLFDVDQFDNDFEDLLRVEGSLGGALRRYGRSVGTAHEVAGDTIEGDTSITGSEGTATYQFDRDVDAMSVLYFQGDDQPVDAGDQFVGITNLLFCAFDYGDAPDTYGTTLAAAGARHVLGERNLWLGTNRPDGESEGDTGGGVATADDGAAIGGIDDEDGITAAFSACPNNGTYSVSVSASDVRTSGTDGAIRGFIDWNRDGDFADADEMSAASTVARANADPSSYTVSWSGVPANCGGTASTFARFRFSTDTAAIASPTGLAPDGEVEDYRISAATLPVTIAHVATVANGKSIVVRFTTATESGNAGFRIWGTNGQGKQVLLATLKSQGSDSFVPQRYEATVGGVGIGSIQIEDVSVFGVNRMHGPFAVGSVFGEPPAAAAIDWAALKNESGVVSDLERVVAAETAAGPADGEGLGSYAAPTTSAASGLLLVRNEGIHRVTYEELRAAGIELAGVDPNKIAVVDNGVGMARFVASVDATFGPGGFIEFVARPQLTLASPVDVYVLSVNARRAVVVTSSLSGKGAPGVTVAVDRHRPDQIYSFSSPNGDPWFDARVLAWGAPATLSRTFDLPNLAEGKVSLEVRVWGYGDFAGTAPDHHVVVKVNGTEVAERAFDGLTAWEPELDVTGLVAESGNVLEVFVPGDTGYAFDNIAFEGFEATYSRATVAQGERFQGTTPRRAFAITGFAAGEPVSVWKVEGGATSRSLQSPVDGVVSAAGGAGDVYAASESALYHPGISAGVPAAKRSSSAQYLIVTHPAFADAVGDLVALEESRGFRTEVVTVDRIFATYSDHASSAAALKSFLSASLALGNLRYVLLVGADTTDPYNHLGTGSVSFVPTDYRNFVQYVTFSPTDESLVDRGNDGLGDVPIGRLPVRTPAELDAVVAKLFAWEETLAGVLPSALLAAGASDGGRAIASVNEAYAGMLGNWGTALAQVDDSNVATVRQSVLDAINSGVELVSYVGHSSPGQWDFTPILKWQDVANLTNFGLPNFFTAWGCWNSYYVEPTIESLAFRLLREPDAGAAGAIGATTLTTDASHRRLGTLFFARANAGATTVGQAFHGAKRDLQQQGGAADAILGMTLLGDPAMSLP